MVQTCWLPDPNERPTFTMLKQTSWQVLSSVDPHETSDNPTPFSINTNDEMLTRYKQIKSCNPVAQRQNIKDRRRQYASNQDSVSTQIYADLESKCKTYYFKNGAETVMYSNEANNGTIPSLFPNGDKLKNHVRYTCLTFGVFEMFRLYPHHPVHISKGFILHFQGSQNRTPSRSSNENVFSLIDLDVFS